MEVSGRLQTCAHETVTNPLVSLHEHSVTHVAPCEQIHAHVGFAAHAASDPTKSMHVRMGRAPGVFCRDSTRQYDFPTLHVTSPPSAVAASEAPAVPASFTIPPVHKWLPPGEVGATSRAGEPQTAEVSTTTVSKARLLPVTNLDLTDMRLPLAVSSWFDATGGAT